MKIDYTPQLDFNSVLIRPKRTTISSRSQVNLKRTFTFPNTKTTWTGVPVISANMDTTGTFEVYDVLSKFKMITCFRKFYSLKDFQDRMDQNPLNPDYFMISTGINEQNFSNLCDIVAATNAKWICVDVANGYMRNVVTFCCKVRATFPDCILVAGNVATREMVEELILNGKVDVVKCGIGPGCFSSDTRILMADGTYKNISEIQVGSYVINRNGTPVKVINKFNKGIRNLIKIRTNNWHDETFVTSDHNYWIGDLSSCSENTIKSSGKASLLDKESKTIPKESKFKWKEINDIEKNKHTLLMPRTFEWKLDDDFSVDLSIFCKMGKVDDKFIITKNQNTNKINRYIHSNYDLGYIFGTFLGDGNSKITTVNGSESGSCHWSFGLSENHIAQKLKNAIFNVLNYEAIIKIKDNKVLSVNCYNKCFTKLLHEFSIKTNKHLPKNYYCKNIEYIKGLYDGLIDSDGHTEITKKDNKIDNLTNTSKYILELFYWCCMNLNKSFSVNKKEKSIGNLNGANIENCQQAYRIKTHTFNRFTKNYLYSEVFDKNDAEEDLVWDIEVDCPTHSFIANNSIVHNSACLTRRKTGVGVPQLSTIIECADGAHGCGGMIIGDGGITCPGDLAKAFGGGADFVMIGGQFAGHDENPGEVQEIDGKKYKLFYGMSSEHAMKKHYGKMANYRSSEGRVVKVAYKGPLEVTVRDYLGGLRSACAYINAHNIKNMPKCTTFLLVNQQLNTHFEK
jgi:IMP dehydrogenase/GMP reductase